MAEVGRDEVGEGEAQGEHHLQVTIIGSTARRGRPGWTGPPFRIPGRPPPRRVGEPQGEREHDLGEQEHGLYDQLHKTASARVIK